MKEGTCPHCEAKVRYYYKSKTQIYCEICKQKVGCTTGNYYKI